MKTITLSFLFLLLPFHFLGQNVSLTGNVQDSTGEGLEFVSVALLETTDSTLANFGTTNQSGKFLIDEVLPGNYILQISFIGYKTHQDIIEVKSNTSIFDLGKITISPELNVLSEVIIDGQRIPVVINRDTVEYNASSFEVRPDENVEDLLKKLPGIEVDKDGNITAQGEEIQKVLVDGKEFFGNNVQMATKNIPADAIKKVKVFDRETDQAKYTGVKDGQKEKTLDLELKEDRKKGLFGDAEIGYGTQNHYKIKGGLHGFTKNSRFSVLGNVNDLNDYGFDWGDMMSMLGQDQNRGGSWSITYNGNSGVPMNFMGPNSGEFSSATGGFNINHDPTKKQSFTANYFATYTDNFRETNTESQEFNRDLTAFSNSAYHLNEIQKRHNAYARYRIDLDSTNRLELEGTLSLTDRFFEDMTRSKKVFEDQTLIQDNFQTSDGLSDDLNWYGVLNYTKRSRKKGRNLNLNLSARQTYSDYLNDYSATFFVPNSSLDTTNLLQEQTDDNFSSQYYGQISYTEPIGEHHFITTKISYADADQDLNRITQKADASIIDTLSPYFIYSRSSTYGSIAYQYQKDNKELSIRANLENYAQQAESKRIGITVDPQRWTYITPGIYFRKESPGRGTFSIDFDMDINLPNLNQWIVNPDISNPLYLRFGNPNLNPETEYSISLWYYNYDSFKQTNWRVSFSTSTTQNPIVSSQTIDSNFVQIIQPINATKNSWNNSIRGGYRFPVKPIKFFLSLNLSANYNISFSPINNEINQQNFSGISPRISFRRFSHEKWDFDFGGSWNFNWSTYSLQPNLNQNFLNQSYYVNLRWRPTPQWSLKTGVDYDIFSQESFAGAAAVPLLNASVTYTLKKYENLSFRLALFDAFQQNTGFSRTADANLIRQTQTNTITRYLLGSVFWKFNTTGKPSKNGGRRRR